MKEICLESLEFVMDDAKDFPEVMATCEFVLNPFLGNDNRIQWSRLWGMDNIPVFSDDDNTESYGPCSGE